MSTYEHHADIENARQVQQADHKSRTHDVQYKKHKRGPFIDDHLQPICPSCGALADPMDREDARTLGRRHTASMAADVTAGVCTCNPAEVERGACILCSKPFPVGGSV